MDMRFFFPFFPFFPLFSFFFFSPLSHIEFWKPKEHEKRKGIPILKLIL